MNPMNADTPLWQQPEGKQLEFKRDLSSPQNVLKTLVAFANWAGGRLVISVDDARRWWVWPTRWPRKSASAT